ncbi:hypothetical protein AVEN_47965-1 [Araneus ventricosus]|uniref:DUF4817 domain-containing protein n=1 Tax=Araneus ventricosus TaxID=182803 RepID=A0A4Y2DP23_ARAVE|nr:hypothetical protein AVEN_47965-1 [Araneus ventricosus]
MAEYTYEELADMHLTYGEAKGNVREARRFYEQRFPTCRIPSHPTFASIDVIDDNEKPVRLPSQTAMQDVREMYERVSEMDDDEATFIREVIFNLRNQYVWSDSNPHCITPRQRQKKFSLNIWASILCDYVVGPYILPDRLTGATYRIFLEQVLHSLLQAVPLPIQRDMWFMHDGAPAHFSSTS